MSRELGVGVVGVGGSPSGWARTGHVPAIAAVDGLKLAAVGARSQESADAGAAAAADLGPRPNAYADAGDLIADPGVDVVSIVSPVPTHDELIRAAIDAGKPVFTEWPVTPGAAATEALARDARSAGVHVAVGLQARTGPAAQELRRLLDAGAIGRILSIDVLSTTAGFGPHIESAMLSLEDPDVGMNLLTIQAAHTLDLASLLGGGLQSFSAQTTIQFPQLSVGDGGESHERVLPDHVAIQGRLRDGGALITIARDAGPLALVAHFPGTARAILEAAGVEATPVRLAAMIAVWARVAQVWRDDEGALNRTMAEIDKRLKEMRRRLARVGAGF